MTREEQIAEQVTTILVEQLCPRKGSVCLEESLAELGADDLDMVELVMALEEKFGIFIPDDDMSQLVTVGGLVHYIIAKVDSVGDRVKEPQNNPSQSLIPGEIIVKMDQVMFILKKDNVCIKLCIHPDKTITLTTGSGQQDFLFRKSRPEMVSIVAELMAKAVALAKVYDIPR